MTHPLGVCIMVDMKTIKQLNNNLIGQLNGINRMLERGDDCFKVVTQMKAVRSGLESAMEKYVAGEFKECLEKGNSAKYQEKANKLFAEIIKS